MSINLIPGSRYTYTIYNSIGIQKRGVCILINSVKNKVIRCNLLTIRDVETNVVFTGSEYEIKLEN